MSRVAAQHDAAIHVPERFDNQIIARMKLDDLSVRDVPLGNEVSAISLKLDGARLETERVYLAGDIAKLRKGNIPNSPDLCSREKFYTL